jgi:hypothetical protein
MNYKSPSPAEDLKSLNALLKNDWSLRKEATPSTPLADLGLNPAAGDLQCLASSLLGDCPAQNLALQDCRTVGDLLEAVGKARRHTARAAHPVNPGRSTQFK